MKTLDKYVLEGESAHDSPLVKNLLSKKKMLSEGNPAHAKIKTALIIGGGGMRAAYSGGIVTGFEKSGLSDIFDVVVGISAGSAVCAYFLSGQSELGASIYYEDLVGKEFMNPARILKIMDIDYLNFVFRKVKPLDQKHIRSSRSDFYVTATDIHTGKGELLDTKDKEIDIIDAICASAALPVVYNKTVTIKGKEYCDGAIGNGIPIDFILQKGCTDILIVSNYDTWEKNNSAPLFERIASILFMRKFTSEFRIATLGRNKLYNQSLKRIRKLTNVNIGFLTPKEMPLNRMSKDTIKMKEVARKAEEQVHSIFSSGS